MFAFPSDFRSLEAAAYGRKRSRSSISLIGYERTATTDASTAFSAPSGVVVMTVTRSPAFAPIARARPDPSMTSSASGFERNAPDTTVSEARDAFFSSAGIVPVPR